jgi:aarF domain-containing kinase
MLRLGLMQRVIQRRLGMMHPVRRLGLTQPAILGLHMTAACAPLQHAMLHSEPAQHSAVPRIAAERAPPSPTGELEVAPLPLEQVGTLRLLWRAATLAFLFAPLLLASPLALISDAWRAFVLRLLVRTLAHAGPCAIKLGQWASTRPDLLPRRICVALGALHEGVVTHSLDDTRRTLERAFGAPVETTFSSLRPVPIGSGCIAQVYKATLHDGTLVAVKVLHPQAARTCASDLALIQLAVRFVEAVVPVRGLRWLGLRAAAEQFETFMLLQIDLRVEAAHLRRFALNFEHAPVRFGRGEDAELLFPRPVDDLVAREVLVETLVMGSSLSHLLEPTPPGATPALSDARRKRLARAGLRAFLQMVLVHNFTHADLHPGNIFCEFVPPANGRGPERLRLAFIDAGLIVELSRRDRVNFLALFEAIAHGDGRRAGALMLEHARESQCDDPAVFTAEIDTLVQQTRAARRGEFTLSKLDVGRVLLDVLSAVREHRVMIEANFTSLVSSICILEGLGRQLDPELDLLTLALPLLARIAISEVFGRHES